jgi:hypothetical protein
MWLTLRDVSFLQPMLCRDFEPIVFDYTYIARIAKQVRFWSQAVQTSVHKQWFVFRWNLLASSSDASLPATA